MIILLLALFFFYSIRVATNLYFSPFIYSSFMPISYSFFSLSTSLSRPLFLRLPLSHFNSFALKFSIYCSLYFSSFHYHTSILPLSFSISSFRSFCLYPFYKDISDTRLNTNNPLFFLLFFFSFFFHSNYTFLSSTTATSAFLSFCFYALAVIQSPSIITRILCNFEMPEQQQQQQQQ